MTGNDLYKRVTSLLGYGDRSYEILSDKLSSQRAETAMLMICNDLQIPVPSTLEDQIVANEKELNALCFGTAMLLAVMDGDEASNHFFAGAYNGARAIAKAGKGEVSDVMPKENTGGSE